MPTPSPTPETSPTTPTPGPDSSAAPRRYRVRRTPNIVTFVLVGAVLGVAAGGLVDILGPSSRCGGGAGCVDAYQPGSALAYLVTLFGLVGAGMGATAAAVADWFFTRR